MSISATNSGTAFKSNSFQQEQTNPYYKKSHAGLIGGSIIGALDLLAIPYNKANEKIFKELSDSIPKPITEKIGYLSKNAVPIALTAAALSVGCGVLIDYLRNKNAKTTADNIQKFGNENVGMYDSSIDYTSTGTPYHKSSAGKTWGALLGIGYGIISALMHKSSVLSTVIGSAIGGFIMGAITDGCHNRSARKNSIRASFNTQFNA